MDSIVADCIHLHRICDTVTFLPNTVPFPQIKLDDFLRQAATDIVKILSNPPSTTTPSLQAGDSTYNALLDLATTLNRIDKIPDYPSTLTPTPTYSSNQSVHEPRVPSSNKQQTDHASLPRVKENPTSVSTLLNSTKS